jgi:hypothetical protein
MAVKIALVLFCVVMLAVWNHIGQPMGDCQLGLTVLLFMSTCEVPGEAMLEEVVS